MLILGGDIAGKGLVPVRTRDGGSISAEVRGEQVAVPAAEEERLCSEINMLGFYPVEMDEAEVERIGRDKPYLEELFRREITPSSRAGASSPPTGSTPRCAASSRPATTTRSRSTPCSSADERVECPERELCELGPAVLASIGDVTRRRGTPSASTPRRSWASGSRR